MPQKLSSAKSRAPKRRTKDACNGCPALCCHDLVLCIERPKNRHDVEYYKWQLQYEAVSIAISDHRWHTVIKSRCMYLDDDYLCTIYERRPEKCRRHNPPDCERFGAWYDVLLTTPDELEEYLAKEKARRKGRAAQRRNKKQQR